MEFKRFSHCRRKTRETLDAIEDWMIQVFEERNEELLEQLDVEDLDLEVAQRRRGVRYFAAGRSKDRRMFASFLFPRFQNDPNERVYREAVEDILRVAGGSVPAKTRHKLSFDPGVLYFTADDRGNLYGVVASDDYPMGDAFTLLEEILEVYDGIDIGSALDKADPSLWNEPRFRDDAFGVKSLAFDAWVRTSRPEDGSPLGPIDDEEDSSPCNAVVSR
eukprot:TRINITY_DN49917_c0_g1_i1.p1 TRINITY_DN49917_c0_g1~~TRINITY_DN49917_c0_g1_i1.p1  ORF type:complete len:219 (+),score=47.94 TRINITY_DN49917_c0_g1_i1:258-914(+)